MARLMVTPVTSAPQGLSGISPVTVGANDNVVAAIQAAASGQLQATQAAAAQTTGAVQGTTDAVQGTTGAVQGTTGAVQGTNSAVNVTGAQAYALSAAQNALASNQVVYLQTQITLLGAINTLAAKMDELIEAINATPCEEHDDNAPDHCRPQTARGSLRRPQCQVSRSTPTSSRAIKSLRSVGACLFTPAIRRTWV